MRWLSALALLLLLPGCWFGGDFYAASDLRPALAPGRYRVEPLTPRPGDEDQGQMSAWFVMAALGLFQTDGGTRVDPIYEIGSPMFEKAVIDLGQQFGRGKTFTIEAKNTSRRNVYVRNATLNGQPLQNFWFKASDLLKGGSLVLEMGPEPNTGWCVGAFPSNE